MHCTTSTLQGAAIPDPPRPHKTAPQDKQRVVHILDQLAACNPHPAPLSSASQPELLGDWALVFASNGTVVTRTSFAQALTALQDLPGVGLDSITQALSTASSGADWGGRCAGCGVQAAVCRLRWQAQNPPHLRRRPASQQWRHLRPGSPGELARHHHGHLDPRCKQARRPHGCTGQWHPLGSAQRPCTQSCTNTCRL